LHKKLRSFSSSVQEIPKKQYSKSMTKDSSAVFSFFPAKPYLDGSHREARMKEHRSCLETLQTSLLPFQPKVSPKGV
jgi:hypothetical protein